MFCCYCSRFRNIIILYRNSSGVEIGLMPGVKMTGAGNGYFLFKWGFILGQGFGATKNK